MKLNIENEYSITIDGRMFFEDEISYFEEPKRSNIVEYLVKAKSPIGLKLSDSIKKQSNTNTLNERITFYVDLFKNDRAMLTEKARQVSEELLLSNFNLQQLNIFRSLCFNDFGEIRYSFHSRNNFDHKSMIVIADVLILFKIISQYQYNKFVEIIREEKFLSLSFGKYLIFITTGN